jgi:hypothetical protein
MQRGKILSAVLQCSRTAHRAEDCRNQEQQQRDKKHDLSQTDRGRSDAAKSQHGRNDCVALLQQTLDEEKAADKKLTAMAESQVNRKAT